MVTARVSGARTPLVARVSSPGASPGRALRGADLWPPPRLVSPTTVRATADDRSLKLDPDADYIVRLPARPLTAHEGLSISGGRHVVIRGGEINVPRAADGSMGRGLYLKDQTGTVDVQGLLIHGSGLGDGINLDQRRGAAIQLQNLRIEYSHAADQRKFSDTHPDLVQTWGGPRVLRINGLTGCTGYQGLFLDPTKFGPAIEQADLRRVNLVGTRESAYLLWQSGRFPVRLKDVWVRPNPRKSRVLWPASSAWRGVRVGVPPAGDFVPKGVAGVRYARSRKTP